MKRCCSLNDGEPFDGAVNRGAECVRAFSALAHPIRLAALVALSRGDLSPSQFARSRGEPVSNVSYHFRLLAEVGLIELARTRPVGGSIEHIYRRVESTKVEGLKLTELVALVSWIVSPWERE